MGLNFENVLLCVVHFFVCHRGILMILYLLDSSYNNVLRFILGECVT
jgi:hypothetical protein